MRHVTPAGCSCTRIRCTPTILCNCRPSLQHLPTPSIRARGLRWRRLPVSRPFSILRAHVKRCMCWLLQKEGGTPSLQAAYVSLQDQGARTALLHSPLHASLPYRNFSSRATDGSIDQIRRVLSQSLQAYPLTTMSMVVFAMQSSPSLPCATFPGCLQHRQRRFQTAIYWLDLLLLLGTESLKHMLVL